jgi:uncharacterized protein YkwD
MWRRYCYSLIFILPLVPSLMFGQEVNEDNVETLQSAGQVSAERPSDLSSKVAGMIVPLTNQFRQSENLPAVKPNSNLTDAAQYFANFMAKTDKYGHRADGKQPADRAGKYGYEYCLVAENIAYLYSSEDFTGDELAKRFVEGWKNSPGHRKNMLDNAVLETGVGIAQSEKTGHWYAVQMFGRPKSAAIEFSIANQSEAEVQYKLADRTFQLPPRYTRTHTLCRPTEAKFEFPENKVRPERFTPRSGGKYVVVQKDGQFEVMTE